jgi:hypothetical protein
VGFIKGGDYHENIAFLVSAIAFGDSAFDVRHLAWKEQRAISREERGKRILAVRGSWRLLDMTDTTKNIFLVVMPAVAAPLTLTDKHGTLPTTWARHCLLQG